MRTMSALGRIARRAISTIFTIGAIAMYANAATFTVTNTDDSGPGSLRQAISDANGSPFNDSIDFALSGCPCVITLTSGELSITNNGSVTINGPGAGQLSVSGNNASRIFFINTGAGAVINGITVTGGNYNGSAGGIDNRGTLALTDSTVSGNSGYYGGGIYNEGTLALADSTVSDNSGVVGGGIFSKGMVTVTNSTVSGNSADWGGGGIFNTEFGSATITNSTVSQNLSTYHGGGVFNTDNGTVTITNSTVSQNSSDQGGGVYNAANGITTMTNSTVSQNSANWAGGIYNTENGIATITNSTVSENSANSAGGVMNWDNAVMTLSNTIIANSTSGNCVRSNGTVNAEHSLVEDGLSCINGTNSNNLTGDPMLGPLQNNGGPTFTHALLPGSPAIDAGTNLNSLATDQRGSGFARTIDDPNVVNAAGSDATDMGAVEFNYITVNTTASDDDGACQPLSDGDCTLREAILAASVAPGTETIAFDIPTSDPGYDSVAERYTIALTSVLPDLDSDMNIEGLGAKRLTVTRGVVDPFRIFMINSDANVSIVGLTISDGLADQGGGIRNAGTLSITDSVIRDNLTLNGSDDCFTANKIGGDGGGIFNVGHLTIDSSLFIGNRTGRGGNVSSRNSDCYKPGNGGNGGAISNPNGTLKIRNSTFSGNSTGDTGRSHNLGDNLGGYGAAIFNGGSLSISNTTITANMLGSYYGRGTVFNVSSIAVELSSSIVANTSGDSPANDLDGNFKGDHNLVGSLSGALTGAHNIIGVDPKLGPLADNGGPTMTHELLCGSPAIDNGVAAALAFDQRSAGFARTFDDPAVGNAADGDGTDIGAFELQEALVCNSAPTANNDAVWTNEDTPLSGSTVLANDTDGENDALTAILVSGPANAQAFNLNADGSFSYAPPANFNGIVQFTYKANDGSLDSNIATVTITVNPVNDAPVTSATPRSKSDVQYSDAIQTVTINGSDVDTPTSSLSISFGYVRDAEPSVTGLPAGMSQGGGPGAWTVSGTAGVAAGTYVMTATVSDGSLSASDTFTIVVTRENATVTPSATNDASVKVNSPGGTAGPIVFCADIADAADDSLGDIDLAVPVTFTFAPVAPGSQIVMQDAELTGGQACVTLVNVPVNVYDVTISVGGDYYTGSGSSVLAVFDPTLGFTTGGGKVLNPSTGNVLHFGFSFKYDKKGFKGQMLVMEHLADGSVTRMKSNSLSSLSIVGDRALVLGKANLLYADGTSVGNLGFRLDATDKGEPGGSDLFGLKTTTSEGAPIDAFWIDPPSTILGGNIQVPQGGKKR